MTNPQRILEYLSCIAPKSASNADICSATGIRPHQQVFQITSRLMANGTIKGRQYGKEWWFSVPSAAKRA